MQTLSSIQALSPVRPLTAVQPLPAVQSFPALQPFPAVQSFPAVRPLPTVQPLSAVQPLTQIYHVPNVQPLSAIQPLTQIYHVPPVQGLAPSQPSSKAANLPVLAVSNIPVQSPRISMVPAPLSVPAALSPSITRPILTPAAAPQAVLSPTVYPTLVPYSPVPTPYSPSAYPAAYPLVPYSPTGYPQAQNVIQPGSQNYSSYLAPNPQQFAPPLMPLTLPPINNTTINLPKLSTALPVVNPVKPVIRQFDMSSSVITENDIEQRRLESLRNIDQSRLLGGPDSYPLDYLKVLATEQGITGASSASKEQLQGEIFSKLAEFNLINNHQRK
jgi:hypothetical protein